MILDINVKRSSGDRSGDMLAVFRTKLSMPCQSLRLQRYDVFSSDELAASQLGQGGVARKRPITGCPIHFSPNISWPLAPNREAFPLSRSAPRNASAWLRSIFQQPESLGALVRCRMLRIERLRRGVEDMLGRARNERTWKRPTARHSKQQRRALIILTRKLCAKGPTTWRQQRQSLKTCNRKPPSMPSVCMT